MGDGVVGKSLVIPLPKGKALRIGFDFRAWCKIGPRRYKVIASQHFVEQFSRIAREPIEETKERLREEGIAIQGELEGL